MCEIILQILYLAIEIVTSCKKRCSHRYDASRTAHLFLINAFMLFLNQIDGEYPLDLLYNEIQMVHIHSAVKPDIEEVGNEK